MDMAKSTRALRVLSGLVAGIVTATAIAVALTQPMAAQSGTDVQATETRSKGNGTMTAQTFVGMWVTADGHIRHELLPNGRYDEARGSKRSAYQGRYVITGTHIDYVDDTGFTADGDFVDGVLHHAGMILRREN
jgi:putative ligand-binding protein with streptavidin-like fold